MYDPTKPYKKEILETIKRTWRPGMPPTSTDGIGSKGVYHWNQRTFHEAVLDSLAMNLNDILVMRSRPIYLQNHIMLPEDDGEAILEIVGAFEKECGKRKIAITGGETSIHKNLHGLEISVNIIGEYIDKKQDNFKIGDYLIGVGSGGLHSNGFTKVRELFDNEFRQDFVKPTIIYSDVLLDLISKVDVSGMMHITGGAYTRLKELLPNSDVVITNKHFLFPQEIFYEMYKKGVSDEEMYKIFNCGVGFVLFAERKNLEKITSELVTSGLKTDIIGRIVRGTGKVKIDSMFSDKTIIL